MTPTSVYEGKDAFYLGCPARILDAGAELAWAEDYIVQNEFHKWILGRYVESDKANFNRQHFTFENVQFGQPTLAHSPLNINHGPLIVGAFAAAEIVFPTEAADGEGDLNPFMEALSVFWKHYFEDEYDVVQTAHKAGRLFYSMECLPKQISCQGEKGCKETFEYAGRTNPAYCEHLNKPFEGISKDLIKPHFTAGALIIPPTKPGWGRADVKQISEIVQEHAEMAETLYNEVAEQTPDEDAKFWEEVMMIIMMKAEAEMA